MPGHGAQKCDARRSLRSPLHQRIKPRRTTCLTRRNSQRPTNAVRPFTIETSETELEALRDRIAATRWPSKELVADRSQGVQLATIQELARYWATDYDWRKCEARLNALPQFTDGDRRRGHPLHPREVAARRSACR